MTPEPRAVVVHWANGHVMRPLLLPEMSKQFNQSGYRTRAGTLIEVKPFLLDSVVQVTDLTARAAGGSPLNRDFPDPTIVTPSPITGCYRAIRMPGASSWI